MGRRAQTIIALKAGGLAASDLVVRSVTGREEISHPFSFDVDFRPAAGGELQLSDLGGAEALLALRRPDGAERFVHGIVWAAEMAGMERGEPVYRVRIVPALARLGLVRRSRVFQALSVRDIVKRVLDGGGVAHRWSLSGSHPVRDYCVQYRESDLDFASRLLESEGICYWFEHTEQSHVAVFGDAPGAFAPIAGDATVPFRGPGPASDAADDEHLSRLSRSHRIRAAKVALRDYDFERPELQVAASTQAAGAPLGLEKYVYPGGFRDPGAGAPVAKARLEEERLPAETFSGESTCARFHPGATFEVADHTDGSFDKKLLLLSVAHEAVQESQAGAIAGIEHGYRNTFLAVDKGVPYRPRRSTRRPVALAETATVVGPAGEEIHPDAHGRVKVQFHWDREGARDEHSSCWIRVAQSWAGPAWGASFVPRMGQEVLVRFLEGDPDAPLVVAAVYNGANPPPFSLPSEKTKCTLRTDSSLGSGGSNELCFEDAKGAEEVYLHAQKDESIAVENDKAQEVVRDEALEVAKDRSREVTGNQVLRVGGLDLGEVAGSQTLLVVGDRSSAVTQSHDERVGVAQTVTVGRVSTVQVGSASAVTVGAAAALSVGGAYAVNVGAALNIAVGGARLEEVGGLRAVAVGAVHEVRVAKDASARVGGDDSTTGEASVSREVSKDDQEDVGGRARLVVAEQITILAKGIELSAQEFALNVGGKAILRAKSGGDLTLSGQTVTVDASGNGAFKGSEVKKTAGAPPPSASAKKETLKKEKVATAKASWSKGSVVALHTDASGSVPGDCQVTLDVQVTDVPDGTQAQITIHHSASGAMVKGGRIECKVQGGKLVDAKSGKPPVFAFGAAQTPWDPYDRPFFFFKASVKHQGLTAETAADAKDGGKALRVKYWHVAVGDGWADTPRGGNLTTGGEAQEISRILKSIPNSVSEARVLKEWRPTLAKWGKQLAGTYAYHHGSHGTVVDRTTGRDIDIDPPPVGFGDPPECPIGNWRSVVLLSYPGRGPRMNYLVLGDGEIRDRKSFKSVPRYLAYFDCCLAGWEPSLGRAFASRGTRYVIAFRRTIPDTAARDMARRFYTKWVRTHRLDPDKIRDVFFEVGTPHYAAMRPVLIGWRYEPILDPAAAAVQRAWETLGQTLKDVGHAVGSFFK